MVSHPPRGPRRDRGLASSLQRRAAAHEPALLDPDRVPIAASTPVHDPQPSRLPGMNGLRILGHVTGCRSPQASAGIPANTREPARSGQKKPQPTTVGVPLLVEPAGIEPASASPLRPVLHA